MAQIADIDAQHGELSTTVLEDSRRALSGLIDVFAGLAKND